LKGILLAGGLGTRLLPMTGVISKQILPVYDKPMVYYPLSVLMLSDIREVLVISTPRDLPLLQELLGNGSCLGMKIEYATQSDPSGIPEALVIGEEFLNGDSVCLVLGDNIFYGDGLSRIVKEFEEPQKALVFGYPVSDPGRYGVLELNDQMELVNLVEKPVQTRSRLALVGLYVFPDGVSEIAKSLQPSNRGETEIVDVCLSYLKNGNLIHRVMGRGLSWFDAGTPSSLLEASSFVGAIQERQGLSIACIEEIAFRNSWIDQEQLRVLALRFNGSAYGEYLNKIGSAGKNWAFRV